MSKRVKILVFTSLFIIAFIGFIHFQARRIVLELIASNASDRIEVKIGSLNINLFNSSLKLQDLSVLVKDKTSENYKKSTIGKVFLDVASLRDFYFGGTLVIEKLELEDGEVTINNTLENDTTDQHTFDLNSIIQRIKTDAIRFQIQDIGFTNFNLVLINDSTYAPTTIKHLKIRARDLYLSVDSILKKKPLVEVSLPGQTIISPKGLIIGFDSLFFSTIDNSIQLNQLKLGSPDDAVDNTFQVNAKKVRIAHFDFETLYTTGNVKIDSVFLGQSNLAVDWQVEHSKKAKIKSSGPPALPEINIRHLIVDELASEITVHHDSIANTFNVNHAFVMVEQLRHRPDSSPRVSANNFNILLAKYSTFLSNSNTSIDFDTVQLQKHRLSLLNFKLHTADQKQPILQTSTFELNQVDWYALLIDKKLVAYEALVLNPIVYTSVKSKTNANPADNLVVLNSLREFLEVQRFSLKNATAFVKLVDKNTEINLEGMNASMLIDEMMESEDVNQGLGKVEGFSFRSLQVIHPIFTGVIKNFDFRSGAMSFGDLLYKSGDNLNISANGIMLDKAVWDQSQQHLTVDGLSWKSLDAAITKDDQLRPQKESANRLPVLQISKIRGKDSKVEFKTQELKLSVLLQQLDLDQMHWSDSLRMNGLTIKGNEFDYHSSPIKGAIGAFSFTDHGGAFENIQFSRMSKDSLVTSINQIAFRTNMQSLANKNIVVDAVIVSGIKTYYQNRDSAQALELAIDNNMELKDIRYLKKKFTLRSLSIESGPINILHTKKEVNTKEKSEAASTKAELRKLRIGIDTVFEESYTLKALQQKQSAVKDQYAYNNNTDTARFLVKATKFKTGNGSVKLYLSAIEVMAQDSAMQINAKVDAVKFNEVSFTNNNLSAWIETGSVNDLRINSSHLKNPEQWINDNYPSAGIENFKAKIETKENLFQFSRLNHDPQRSRSSITGFEFRPLKSKQEFLDDSYYQTNYMRTKADSISFYKIDIKRFLEDSVIHLSSLYIGSPDLDIHRDKTHPFFSTALKLLPTNALQKAGIKFKADTLLFDNGKINYTEKSRITGKEGAIHFTKLQGIITNVKNIDLQENDSLYIQARTRFLDSAKVMLRVRESYHDTLAGFLLTTNVSPFHTSILNNALVPMVAVQFQSGRVDTLQMHAIGREYLSLGSMKFLYRDLKVNFLDHSDTSRHPLKNQLLKFAANTFVIKANNKKRTGVVFYERDRNRAVFQYWIKMILSGATTSVGVKSNRKQVKQYMKDLNQKRLPRIDKDFKL